MKRRSRSILAILMALAVVLSSFAGLGVAAQAETAEIAPRTIFADDCNAQSVNAAWAAGGGSATADGEKYTLSKGTIYLPYNLGMTDYTVQADVSIPDTTSGQGIFTSTGVATICVRHNPTTNAGYEIGLAANKDSTGGAMVRMFGRNGATSLNQSYSIADALYNGDSDLAAPGNVYTLKIKVSGSQVTGYVNSVQLFEITDTNFTHGTVALKALNCVAAFDNVKVYAHELLYADDFSQSTTMAQRGWSTNRTIENGEMILSGTNAYLSNFAHAQTWSNYSVEVDIRKEYIVNNASARGAIVGLVIGSKGTKRSGIEFCIIEYSEESGWQGNFVNQDLRLYNADTSAVMKLETVAQYNAAQETPEQAWEERPYKPENGLRMKLQVINYGTSGKLIGYINGKEVLSTTVSDVSSLTGAPGIMTSTGHIVYCDNFKVYNELNYLASVTDIQLQDKNGNNVNEISLYRGFEIETTNYQLQATYGDGSVKQIPLATEWVSYHKDGLQLGRNQVAITYEGNMITLPVIVTERPAYVAAFQKKLAALSPGTLTAADATAVAELKVYFSSLSPYEVSCLSQVERETYKNLVVKMDRLVIPEAKEQSLLFYDDLTTVGLDTEKWNISKNNQKLKWFERNGYLLNAQRCYEASGESWLLLNQFSGDVDAAEVDICLNETDVYGILVFNYDGSRYYQARITNRNGIYRAELYRYDGVQKYLGGNNFSKLGLTGQDGVSYALRVTEIEGLIKVYVNGILAITYNDGEDLDALHDGGVGFRNLYGAVTYDNLRLYGELTSADPNLPKDITPTEYTDNFEDEVVGTSPSHWVEDYDYTAQKLKDQWKVYSVSGNKVYGTTHTDATYTWLHGFDQNPEYSAKFMYSGSGKTGFVTRLYDELSWLVIGYDTAKQTWFTAASECTAQEPTQVIWAETATPLAANTWHTVSIVLNGTKATLVVNGQTVMQVNNAACDSYGRVGVFSQGPQTYVDDIYVKSTSGTTFVDGVVDYSITDGTARTGSYLEIEDLGNGHLVGVNGGKQFHSYDNGETWTEVTGTDAAYDIAAGGMGYTSVLNLGDGNWVQVRVPWNNAHSLVSHDNMKTWTKTAEYIGQDEYVDQYGNGVIACIHVNSLSKATVNGKTRIFWPLTFRRLTEDEAVFGHYTRFFYSDDGGYTWTESQNDTRDVLPGYAEDKTSTTAEGKIVQCADGSLRYYQTRNDYGNMIYFESIDGGVSWTNFGTIPYMQCPKGSFSVTEDIYNPGTYYLTWVHCNPVNLGSIQSRVRISLARSTNGKDWEFLCDVERTSIHSNEGSSFVRQFLDPNITVNEEYVYVAFGRSSISLPSEYHNNQIPRYVRFEKDKLSARPWDDATISNSNFTSTIELVTAPQIKFSLNETFTYWGGIIRETSFNGAVKERKTQSYTLVSDLPDTSKPGVYTVTLANLNMHLVSYQVYVGTTYDLTWNVGGAGTVQGQTNTVLQGSSPTFTLVPQEGYKVGSVTVDGVAVELQDNAFTVENIQKDLHIDVTFVDQCADGHTYDNDLDPDCNLCGEIREIVPAYMVGDLNGDRKVTDADATYLLMHTFFPGTYPLEQDGDYNGDGKITDADAVRLLMHTFFPETYPIG